METKLNPAALRPLYEAARFVMAWWDDHEYDTRGNSEDGERNVYDEEPDMVSHAREALRLAILPAAPSCTCLEMGGTEKHFAHCHFPAENPSPAPDKPPEDAATAPPLPEGEGAGSCPACAPHYWVHGIPDRWKFCPMCAKPLSRTMAKHPDQRGTIAQMDAAMDTVMTEFKQTAARLRAERDLEGYV